MWNQYFTPTDISDALRLMKRYRERARIIAGGTDLILDFSSKRIPAVDVLVDVSSIPELKKITLEDGSINIGAGVTLSEILHSNLLKSRAPVLVEATRKIAGPQIRNIATIGGNVVNASPAADMLPPLLVLNSMISIIGPNRRPKKIRLSDFLLGNRKVKLRTGEIVTGFNFPAPDPSSRHYFRKIQPRRSMAIAMLSLAILLKIEDDRISDIKIGMGAVAPTAVRIQTVERELRNLPIEKLNDPKLYTGVVYDIHPISDFRASRIYRLRVAQNLLREAIVGLLDRTDP